MNFKPQSEKEIIQSKLFKAGVYDFVVLDGSERLSQKGRPMIEIKVKVSDEAGNSRTLTDYLLAESPLKLRHASEVCGVLDKYDTGSIGADDFIGKRGKVKLAIEKDRARKYPDKNVIADYVTQGATGSRFFTA